MIQFQMLKIQNSHVILGNRENSPIHASFIRFGDNLRVNRLLVSKSKTDF